MTRYNGRRLKKGTRKNIAGTTIPSRISNTQKLKLYGVAPATESDLP